MLWGSGWRCNKVELIPLHSSVTSVAFLTSNQSDCQILGHQESFEQEEVFSCSAHDARDVHGTSVILLLIWLWGHENLSCRWHMYVQQGTVADHIITIVATIKNQSSTAQSPTDIVNTYCSFINTYCLESSLGALQHSKQIILFLYTPICPLLEWLPLACFEAVPSFIKTTPHSEGRSSGGKKSCLRMCKVNYFHCYTMTQPYLLIHHCRVKKSNIITTWSFLHGF